MKPENDCIVFLRLEDKDLALGKVPPLCDSCNVTIAKEHSDSAQCMYNLNGLILGNSVFWGLLCHNCILRHHPYLRNFPEHRIPKELSDSIRLSLSKEVEVLSY